MKRMIGMTGRRDSDEGITTTMFPQTTTTFGDNSPQSTQTKFRDNDPEIAGSTGGFIGLIAGLSIFILLSLFLGIYLWNRHRHRVRRGPTRTIPSLLFTAPTNTDPYAEEPFSYTILPATQTTYSNQHDAEWELPLHTSTLRANRHLRGKRDDWAEAEVDSPGLTRREHEDYPFHSQVPRHLSSGGMITSPSDKEDPREGDRVMRETPWGPTRIENPFEGGDETMRLSPDMRSVSERDDGDSAEGSGSSLERSVRIGEKQGDGSRFVETFSTESLVSS